MCGFARQRIVAIDVAIVKESKPVAKRGAVVDCPAQIRRVNLSVGRESLVVLDLTLLQAANRSRAPDPELLARHESVVRSLTVDSQPQLPVARQRSVESGAIAEQTVRGRRARPGSCEIGVTGL